MDNIDRHPFYISDELDTLFCWVHKPRQDADQKDCVVVICNPLGHEYIHTHRTVLHLADQLAHDRFPTIRFDYAGTGDSTGNDFNPDRLGAWQRSIKTVISHAKTMSGCSKICLIGIRMGALLAALVASESDVSCLVLFNPCVDGRHYVKEMKALALMADHRSSHPDHHIESAGFVFSAETLGQIEKLNLLNIGLANKTSVLLIDRDDAPQSVRLLEVWAKSGIDIDYCVASGYLEMFAEPHKTVVPEHTLQMISEWLTKKIAVSAYRETPPQINEQSVMQTDPVSEQLCRFGSKGQLFGILTTPLHPTDCVKPVVVLLNAGSVHHVGANRLYVFLARALATQGFPCFRIDIGGIGDSILQNTSNENHPYQEFAVQDTETALGFLSERFRFSKFVLAGLCSGGYTAFCFGLQETPHNIVDTLLINPLTFYWEQGMSVLDIPAITRNLKEVSYYKTALHNPKSWMKLLKGKAHVKHFFGVIVIQMQARAKSYCKSVLENFWPQKESPGKSCLSSDIKCYFRMNRHLSFFLAATDPGYDIVMMDARSVFKKGIKENKISLEMFQDVDHTFSPAQKRDELIARLIKHLTALRPE